MAILVFIMSGSENPSKATAKRPRVEHQGDNPGDRQKPIQRASRARRKILTNKSPYLDDDSDGSNNEPLVRRTQGQRRVVNAGESSNININENRGIPPAHWSMIQQSQPFTHKLYRFVGLHRIVSFILFTEAIEFFKIPMLNISSHGRAHAPVSYSRQTTNSFNSLSMR